MALCAFDGTWNDSSRPAPLRKTNEDTNVQRFLEVYQSGGGTTCYVDGGGTRFGKIGKIWGGLTGAGAEARIREQFDKLKKNFERDDIVIDIVGYSRGAAIARMFVHRIEQDFGGLGLDAPPTVRFLGLFDTVASFGVPWTDDEGDFLPYIPEFVEQTYHAMALDETRETFGIERCYGNRTKITEVWFRGGHGDIGGNATYKENDEAIANLKRSGITLNWMLHKVKACGLPVNAGSGAGSGTDTDAHVTAKDEPIAIGNVGTLSRRIHLGDLVHHTVEKTELTRGLDRRILRRITVATAIEDREMEKLAEPLFWVPVSTETQMADNVRLESAPPSLVELSSRRYPFDVPPARTWRSWLEDYMELDLKETGFNGDRLKEFWSATEADRRLAWEIYVELATRIATVDLDDEKGNDRSALNSVYNLFKLSRECMRSYGPEAANAGALVTAFLNGRIRKFTEHWHQISLNEGWQEGVQKAPNEEFRAALKPLQVELRKIAAALSLLAGAEL